MAGAAQDQAAQLRARGQVGGEQAVEFRQLAGQIEILGSQSWIAGFIGGVRLVAWMGGEPHVAGSFFHTAQVPRPDGY